MIEEGKKYYEFSLAERIFFILLLGIGSVGSFIPLFIEIEFIVKLISVSVTLFILSVATFLFSYFTIEDNCIIKTGFLFIKTKINLADLKEVVFNDYRGSTLTFVPENRTRYSIRNIIIRAVVPECVFVLRELLYKKYKNNCDENTELLLTKGFELKMSRKKSYFLNQEGIKIPETQEIIKWEDVQCSVKNKKTKIIYTFVFKEKISIIRYLARIEIPYDNFFETVSRKCKKITDNNK
ncbi:MAG: hypothetical protein J6Y36_03120 [Treponema sp.]|nr:hypothetical protein [Treponema sp.]